MSRRHHGRAQQGGRYRHDPPRPAPGTAAATPGTPAASVDAGATAPGATNDAAPRSQAQRPASAATVPAAALSTPSAPVDGRDGPRSAPGQPNGHTNGHANGHAPGPLNGMDRSNGCTAPQLRRFIKSRPYVPMHELRRRFAIDGGDDDVTQVSINHGHIYVGLPQREGSLLGELLRGGDIGYELSLDPRTPVVVGVYPMRPVPRS